MFKPEYPQLKTTDGELFPVHRIYCVAKNYADHVREMGSDPERESPFFFSKPADAVTQSTEVSFPTLTENLHHEVELVLALGEGGSIYGYAVGVDLTRRDLQAEAKRRGRPWDMAKGFDQSAPISEIIPSTGPFSQLDIRLQVNSVTRQSGNTAQMIWSVEEILTALGSNVELKAGDLIFTGTPAGVSRLQRGDNIDISLGSDLRHRFTLV
ncbi:MAG: fumarylacetoacetate hydrolase family protein [Proteobacteria bacterium]|nr:fumarylacetoacetate hydrolase family protein [Pseudomonadota bacterium]